MSKLYTIGEIARLELLKNALGESYKHKASVAHIVREMDYVEVITPHGLSKCLNMAQIQEHNAKWGGVKIPTRKRKRK